MARLRRSRGLLTPLAACLLLAAPARSQDAPTPDADAELLKLAAGLYDGVRAETLPNGLRVFLKPVPGAPTVTTMVAYKVGSADEDKDLTGLSHYLEHLLFKGTEKLMPGDIDRITQRNGGQNNAYTSEDMTVYHFDFAADRWTAALEIEADRMRNVRIDARHEFEQEKGAVIAELEGAEDQPWELEHKAILPLLFGEKAPYGHPIIGQRGHVRGATAEVIKRYYDTWYHPNNAAIVVCGGFEPEPALAAIRKRFGDIPRADLPERKPAVEPKARPKMVRHRMDSKFEQPRLLMGFNTVRGDDADAYPLDVLQNVLAGGKTSRLYRKLVEGDRLASSVGASHSSGRYPGWFAIQAESLKKDLARLETAVTDELRQIAEKGVTPEELRRVRRGMIAATIFGNEDIHEMADTIAQGVTGFDLDYVRQYLPRVAAVTSEDLRRVAKKYFLDAHGVVVWSQPAEDVGGNPSPDRGGDQSSSPRLGRAKPPAPPSFVGKRAGTSGRRLPRAKSTPSSTPFTLKDAREVTLPNGLTLLLFENRRMPIVVAEAFVRNVRMREPADKAGVAALVGDMLAEGTTTRTGNQIARLIEDAGGVLSTDSAGGTVKVLTPDTELGLDLLFDCLVSPSFPAEEMELQRELLITAIEDEEGSPQSSAKLRFQRLLYGAHPLGRSQLGKKDVVERLTAADCREHHGAVFRPNNTVVAVVGDFDSARIIEGVTRRTAGWKRAELAPLPAYPLKPAGRATEKIESDEEAAQLHVYLGHLGVRRDNPDYHKLLVMEHVLGTGPGFTDRLSASLRDRQGLAYSVHATITPAAAEEVGAFVGYIGTYPDKYEVVKQGFLKEIRRIRDEAPTEEEVESAKKYLLGNVAFRFTTNELVAGELVLLDRFHLGFGYLEKYRKEIAAVTPEDVRAVAQKYLDPDRIAVVAVGPIDQAGKPLKKDE